MQLSIPIFKGDDIYDQCEFQKPKTGKIANTLYIYENNGVFQALLEFISSSIVSLTKIDGTIIDNKDQIKACCRRMSYITAEVIAIQIMLLINKDDTVEGVYECPRCHKKIITGKDSLTGDNSDKISDLEIINQGEDEFGEIDQDSYNNIIHIDLEEPVIIKHAMTGNIIEEINSIDLRFPTLDDCIKGSQKYPKLKDIKKQFAIYTEALLNVNDEPVTKKWRKTWGEFMFNNLDPSDTGKITEQLVKYGLQRKIEKICIECGKRWKAPVNTANFFESGLRSV